MTYTEKLPIKTWAEEDRPREKLLLKGRHSLTEAELIAILIGSGNATESAVDLSKRILHTHSNDLNTLAKLSVNDFLKFKGIGEAKAISIIAALELGRRRKESQSQDLDKIVGSNDAFQLVLPDFMDLEYEKFMVLLLNRGNKVIKKHELSTGGITGTIADPKLIFKIALDHFAVNIVLCHNHPSGNRQPSQTDIELTTKLKKAGQLLDIAVIDHLIIAGNSYFSFADEGLM